MTILSLEDKHIKDLTQQALLELFEELFEDIGIAKAMREGEDSEVVSEQEVTKILKA